MKPETYTNALHIGRKIERVRRLRGMTQTDLGDLLGITKQAVSKMEQTEKLDDERVKQVAEALGVTEEGLKKFTEENCTCTIQITFMRILNATATNIGTISNLENINHFSMDQAVKLFEELLKIEREKYSGGKEESAK